MAERIQMRRTKGWKKPEGAVYVGRPSMDSNRHMVVRDGRLWGVWIGGTMDTVTCGSRAEAHTLATALFRQDMEAARDRDPEAFALTVKRLRGRHLCCWCPPELACHADVLLECVNA